MGCFLVDRGQGCCWHPTCPGQGISWNKAARCTPSPCLGADASAPTLPLPPLAVSQRPLLSTYCVQPSPGRLRSWVGRAVEWTRAWGPSGQSSSPHALLSAPLHCPPSSHPRQEAGHPDPPQGPPASGRSRCPLMDGGPALIQSSGGLRVPGDQCGHCPALRGTRGTFRSCHSLLSPGASSGPWLSPLHP